MSKEEKPDAVKKLKELLHCGNERVEFSAAKELLSLKEEKTDPEETRFRVEIRVLEGREENG